MEGQFGFRVYHSTTLQCMRRTDHATLNFNNNKSTAAVFLDIEKVFDARWHLSYLYKLSKWKYSISLIKFISSFLSQKSSETRSKVNCLHQGIHKQGCHKVLSCPPYCTVYI
jgi:hypothetical protein